ncbi:MAG: UDP-N-acetylmuramyl pentapeptide phosphotransferase/UDP-N-acetylglucosamine-1-phosphate transferase [Bacteroidetes bacterium OLB11]|nr:MAG: UDP-N-acetylmuramyl pentapeptide phosphotransferase/UDP-N-acetylglucosamine-1-phosphate transferase [Bacteroidetes bacterium OLB11]
MNSSLLIYVVGAFVVSLITQYLVIDLSHKKGIFIDDHNSDLPQKLHREPTPRIGGLGIFVAILFMTKDLELGLYIILCIIPAFLAGFLEDLLAKITPWRRLLIMSVSSIMAIYLMDCVVVDFGFITVPYFVGVIITIVAILGLINGTNMIDGFNGLSSGVSVLIFATYFAVSYIVGDTQMMYITLICIAAILGFLFFNFPRGKIFLGDGGAYSLGFLLAVISIMLVKRHSNSLVSESYISPWFALVSLIYPVWEVIFSFTRRTLVHRLSPLYPDSKHVHQLIYRNIAKQNNPLTTLFIYPVVISFNIFAVLFYNNSLILFIVSIIFITLYSLFYFLLFKKRTIKK